MKGWIDRVLRPGVAYRFVEGDSGEGVPGGAAEGAGQRSSSNLELPFRPCYTCSHLLKVALLQQTHY